MHESAHQTSRKTGKEMLRKDYEKLDFARKYFDRKRVKSLLMAEIAARQEAFNITKSKESADALEESKDRYFDFIFHMGNDFLSSGYTDAVDAKNEKSFARKLSVAMADLHRSRVRGTFARIKTNVGRFTEFAGYAVVTAAVLAAGGIELAIKQPGTLVGAALLWPTYTALKRFSKVGRAFHKAEITAIGKGMSFKEFNMTHQKIIQKYENYKSTARKISLLVGIGTTAVLAFSGVNPDLAKFTHLADVREFLQELFNTGTESLKDLVSGIV